jgi:PAS domain-containing protein
VAAQKPLELILARNLLTSISTPAFLVDEHAALVFYNEAAGALLGRSFEDAGRMSPEEWTSTYGPFDSDGKPLELDELPTTRAVRDGRPAHAVFTIQSANGGKREIQSSAFPIIASEEGSSGAMIFFWPHEVDGAEVI